MRPGAVDVARYWHDQVRHNEAHNEKPCPQGFLLLYVTARPDMQERAVSAWVALHNFPHALLFFAPSFSTDPLNKKTCYLRQLQTDGIAIHAAYGSNKVRRNRDGTQKCSFRTWPCTRLPALIPSASYRLAAGGSESSTDELLADS